jgi:hypothetical protein
MSQGDLFDKPDDLQHYKQEEKVCEHCGHHGTLESKISDLTMKFTVLRNLLKEGAEDHVTIERAATASWLERVKYFLSTTEHI